MDLMRTYEGMKQNKLNIKPILNKRGRPQKCKANDESGSGNWKFKFRKVVKKDQGLKSIMSIMATEGK